MGSEIHLAEELEQFRFSGPCLGRFLNAMPLAVYAVISKKREAGGYLTNYLVGFLGVSRESVRLMHQPISLKG